MESWKIWLIVCSILSIICGLVATFGFFYSIYANCFYMPEAPCYIDESKFELWWSIPLAFFIGFIIPGIAYVIGKITDVFY